MGLTSPPSSSSTTTVLLGNAEDALRGPGQGEEADPSTVVVAAISSTSPLLPTSTPGGGSEAKDVPQGPLPTRDGP